MELLRYINEDMKHKISLADIMNNNIAIGIQTEEEFYSLYSKLIALSPSKDIAISKDVWEKYMITHEWNYSNDDMINDGIMYICIYGKDCCGFSGRTYYVKRDFNLILFKDVVIDYTYNKEYGIWTS